VEGERADAIPPQLVGDMIGGVLGGDKNEDALPAFGRDEVTQQGRPFRFVDADGPLLQSAVPLVAEALAALASKGEYPSPLL
jgi:hypothetical protein